MYEVCAVRCVCVASWSVGLFAGDCVVRMDPPLSETPLSFFGPRLPGHPVTPAARRTVARSAYAISESSGVTCGPPRASPGKGRTLTCQ